MTRHVLFRLRLRLLLSGLIVCGCSEGQPLTRESAPEPGDRQAAAASIARLASGDREVDQQPKKIRTTHLPNAIQVHDKVISGGQPEGDAAFQELRNLGVRTVISVDGAKPDLERAKKYGLRYVHLPHSYDGISELRAKELAKAVRDLEGPIYIHCHHGKHRSPAAAAVACVSAGLLDPSMSAAILEVAGTNPNYRGLYEAAESAQKLDRVVLDAMGPDFPEVAKLPPMAEAMVNLDQTQERLKRIALANWRPPTSHPDLDPAHEALLLGEHFTEMLRTEGVAEESEDFREMLRASESAARELELALRRWNAAGNHSPVPESIESAFHRISTTCTNCHTRFRDLPLSEKLH